MAKTGLKRQESSGSGFEEAANSIVSGDIATLERLLSEDPSLVFARSTRPHKATLLHYVSANGVEDYRQKTPQNIVEIARTLLDAGAEIDATANMYGGRCTALGLAATSVHPERAGVQEKLLQLLLHRGAKMEQALDGGQTQCIVNSCLANGRRKAAEFLASSGARLDLAGAAGLGRLDVIKTFFSEDGSLRNGATPEQLKQAFLYSCAYGRNNVVEFLIGNGVDLGAQNRQGQTGLHCAVIGGHPHTVRLLLKHNAQLETKNIYGATVLGQALWSAAHGGDPDLYIEILETLLAAGAHIPERHVAVNKRVDEWLERHGSHAEPTWYWYGEEPNPAGA